MQKEKERFLKVSEIAEILGVKSSTIYQWSWQKKNLPFVKIGKLLRVSEKDLFSIIQDGKKIIKK